MIKVEVITKDNEKIGTVECKGTIGDVYEEMVCMTGKLILGVMEKACIPGYEDKFIALTLRKIEDYVMQSEKMQEIHKATENEIDRMLRDALKKFFEDKEDK